MHPSWPQITNNINKFNVTPQLKARKGDGGAWLINVLKYFVEIFIQKWVKIIATSLILISGLLYNIVCIYKTM